MRADSLKCFQKRFLQFYKRVAVLCVRKPYYFIIIPIILTLVFSSGFIKFKLAFDIEEIFATKGGEVIETKRLLYHYFPRDKLNYFDYSREFRIFSGYGRIIIHTKDENTLFRKHIVQDIITLDKIIHNLTFAYEGRLWDFETLCGRANKRCIFNPVISYFEKIDKFLNGSFKIKYPIEIGLDNEIYFSGIALGNVTLNNSYVKFASFGSLGYFLDFNKENKDLIVRWEHLFIETVSKLKFEHINLYWITSGGYNECFAENGFGLTDLFLISGTLIFIFSTCACMMTNCVLSKPWIGTIGCISALMGVISGTGIGMWLDIPFPPTNIGIPFILLAIGVDDTFILLTSWRSTKCTKTLEERIVDTYYHAAIPITLTSFTNFLSLLAVGFLPFDAAKTLAFYGTTGCLFSYINQMTFTAGWLVLFGRAENNNRNGNFPFLKAVSPSKNDSTSSFYKFLFVGEKEQSKEETWLMAFFRDCYAELLSKKMTKVAVLFIYLIYLSGAVYGVTNMSQDISIDEFFPKYTYANRFLAIESQYLSDYQFRFQLLINTTVDYSDPEMQSSLNQTLNAIYNLTHISKEPELTDFWFNFYKRVNEEKEKRTWLSKYSLRSKSNFINFLRYVFLRLPHAQRYKNDIAFNQNFTDIIASRLVIQGYKLKTAQEVVNCFQSVRRVINKTPFKMYLYHPLLILAEGFIKLNMIVLSTIGLTIIIMIIVTYFFIPDLTVTLGVTLSVLSIQFGILGYLSYWGVEMNVVVGFTIILFIGVSVDNAAHIMCAYVTSQCTAPNECLKDSLFKVGAPIVQANITTFLGLSTLWCIYSYVHNIVFKIGVYLIIFTAFHSLALLPVFLSLVKRKKPTLSTDEKESKSMITNGK